MEKFSALLALWAGNLLVTSGFPSQRPVTWSFDAFFDLCLKNGWVNNGGAGNLRRHHAHYDVIVMQTLHKEGFIYYGIFADSYLYQREYHKSTSK